MKRVYLFALLLCAGSFLYAQEKPKPGGIFNHVIDVATYSDWGKGYLTIVDCHYYNVDGQWYRLTFDPVGSEKRSLWISDIILDVNGKSTWHMTPSEFYDIVDNSDEFTLTFENRKGEKHTQKYSVRRTKGEKHAEKYLDFRRFILGEDLTNIMKRDKLNAHIENLSMRDVADRNFDFQKIRTYDYLIVGNDPLNDTKLLDDFDKFGLKRDSNTPDILFTIAKNADESISSIYIPPTSRTVNMGSTTTSSYNSLTKGYDYVTRQRNKTIHEGGYTQTTKTADIFFEIAALDAKKINDKSISYAPIVWQTTTKRYATDYNFNLADELQVYAKNTQFPPFDRWVNKEETLFEKSGLIADENDPIKVADVLPGSRAEAAGFQKGDVIKNVEFWRKSSSTEYRGGEWVHYKKWKIQTVGDFDYWQGGGMPRAEENTSLFDKRLIVTVKRNHKKVVLTLYPRSLKFSRSYLVGPDRLQ